MQQQSDALPMVCAQRGAPLQNTRWRDLQLEIVVGQVKLRVRCGSLKALEAWVCPARQAWDLPAYGGII